jgi:flagellar hook-basal body complex protein FliE
MIPAVSTVTATSGVESAAGIASGLQPNAIASTDGSNAAAPFADLMTDAVGDVDRLQSQAEAAVTGLMTGNGVDVHQAMIATEKASMAFELALAVRNKAVQAYQSVIGMQF